MKIGVLSDCFGLGFEKGVQKAAQLGAQGVQLYAVEGELAPENLNKGKRSFIRSFMKDQGMEISAIRGDLGYGGFAFSDRNPEKIERTKRIVDLALDLGCGIITTHIGVVPRDQHHPRYAAIRDALGELGDYAQRLGGCFAIETGPETPATLCGLLDELRSPGVGVNLDPANLAMCTGDDAAQAVHTLKKYIVHTHAKDGILIAPCDMDIMYGMVEASEGFDEWAYCREVPLGEGQVDFDRYIAALKKVGYDGYLTIEREVGDDPAGDIASAIDFLRKYL